MARLTLILSPKEQDALMTLAMKEIRDPAGQVRYMLRVELERRGLMLREIEEPLPRWERVTDGDR